MKITYMVQVCVLPKYKVQIQGVACRWPSEWTHVVHIWGQGEGWTDGALANFCPVTPFTLHSSLYIASAAS